MPGVPRELDKMMDEQVLPRIEARLDAVRAPLDGLSGEGWPVTRLVERVVADATVAVHYADDRIDYSGSTRLPACVTDCSSSPERSPTVTDPRGSTPTSGPPP